MGEVRVEARVIVGGLQGGGPGMGTGGRAAGRVITPVGGIVGQSRAEGAWEAALTLCATGRSRGEVLIGEGLESSAEEVGRVATMDCMVASWVVTVSSCLVMDASPLSEKDMNRMRMDSPSDRSLSCLLSEMGICSGVKRSLSRVL